MYLTYLKQVYILFVLRFTIELEKRKSPESVEFVGKATSLCLCHFLGFTSLFCCPG